MTVVRVTAHPDPHLDLHPSILSGFGRNVLPPASPVKLCDDVMDGQNVICRTALPVFWTVSMASEAGRVWSCRFRSPMVSSVN